MEEATWQPGSLQRIMPPLVTNLFIFQRKLAPFDIEPADLRLYLYLPAHVIYPYHFLVILFELLREQLVFVGSHVLKEHFKPCDGVQ
jgi:hypothetical protein